MNVSRFFRNLFRGKPKPPKRGVREPFWDRLPHLNLPRIRLPEMPPIHFPKIRLPEMPPIHFPKIRLPELPAANIRVPSLPNPFANFAFIIEERQRFFVTLNWLGYVLVFASLLDYILILYPPQLTDPRWELQAMTNLVNNAWFFLLGLILVFLPTRTYIRRLELNFLSFLRLTILMLGVLSILLIPLGVLNTQRIHTDNVTEINQEQIIQQRQMDALKEVIETRQLLPLQLQRVGQELGIEDLFAFDNPRQTLIEKIQERKQQIDQQANNKKKDRFQRLITQSVRTHFGAFLSALCLLRLWWETRWVKAIKDYIKEEESA